MNDVNTVNQWSESNAEFLMLLEGDHGQHTYLNGVTEEWFDWNIELERIDGRLHVGTIHNSHMESNEKYRIEILDASGCYIRGSESVDTWENLIKVIAGFLNFYDQSIETVQT